MKKLSLVLLLLVGVNGLRAQITVVDSTLPKLGDLLQYGIAQNQATNAMITPPGFNLVWNFSGLTTNLTYAEQYRSPAQGQFAAKFPLANLLVIDSTGERYYRVTTAGLDLLGFSEKQLFGYPFTVLHQLSNAYRERVTPLNFFDIYQTNASEITGFSYAELPAGLKAAYLAAGITTMDSLRLRSAWSKTLSVNGSGTLTIPGPDPKPVYEVLRQVQTEYSERRVDAKIVPLGWLDITDFTLQHVAGAKGKLGVDTLGLHRFFDAKGKEVIVSIPLDAEGRPSGDVQYKNNFPVPCLWTGSVNTSWGDAGNWSCAKVLGATDEVIITSGTVVVTGAVTVKRLTVSPGAQINVSSGTLTVLQ